MEEPGADSEEKHEPASDVDAVMVDSLKALDPERPSLMFAFKGRRAVFYSAAADCADRWCAQQETGPEDAG